MFFVVVTRVIGALQVFDVVYMMIDKSNPALEKTQSLVYLFYTIRKRIWRSNCSFITSSNFINNSISNVCSKEMGSLSIMKGRDFYGQKTK